jgi:hypothetical protein
MTDVKHRRVRWSAALVVPGLVGLLCGVLSTQAKQITGAVLSATGDAIAGATASLVTADETDRAEVVRTQTGGSGEYVLPFSRSAGVLTVEASGYVTRHIPIRSGERATWAAIRLQPARSISGQVVGEPGDVPLAADILILQAAPDLNARSIQAGKGGSFTISEVDASEATLIVRAEGYAQRHLAISATAESASGVVIRLSRLAILQGKVADPSGRPVAGAEVSLSVTRPHLPILDLESGKRITRTLASGEFLIQAPPELPVTIQVQQDGCQPEAAEPVRLSAGESRDVGTVTMSRCQQ